MTPETALLLTDVALVLAELPEAEAEPECEPLEGAVALADAELPESDGRRAGGVRGDGGECGGLPFL